MNKQKVSFKNFIISFISALTLLGSIFPFNFNFNEKTAKASAITNVYNNAIYVTFEDGDTSWIKSTPTRYENTYSNLYKNALNDSPNSVKDYYNTMSYGSLNLETKFYSNSGNAVVVPYTLNELLPYSPNNTDGYYEYEAAVYSGSGTPSMLSTEYFNSTHKYNIYVCGESDSKHRGVPCDTDLSDGVGCKCAYESYKESSSENVVLFQHVEHYFRLQVALRSALSQVSTQITGNVDYDNDNYVDMISFIFPEMEAGTIKWGELLWAHQGQLNVQDVIPADYQNTFYLAFFLQSRGLRGGSNTEIQTLLKEIKVANKKVKRYICLTTDNLTSTSPLTDANGVKTLTNFVFAHELGHALGLPDYYVYDDDYTKDPVSYWDLMGYNYDGFPIYMTTYSRQLLNFTNNNNIQKISNNGTYTLKPTSYDEVKNNSQNSNNVLAYYLEDENYPNQKIYLEYRYKQGKYDSGPTYKANGLLIYRIDNGIKQTIEYSGMLSSGNFYGYPFNIEVLGIKSSGSFGNSNISVNTDALTFQNYNSSKDQSELRKNNVTFTNTGIVISNISVNSTTNEISFDVSFGSSEVDLSSVKLNGESQVNHEVNTSYTDLGIDFGDFSSSDFTYSVINNVKINELGQFTYIYNLTHNITKQTLTLTRTVNVKDTIKPIIILKGSTNLTLDNLDDYVEAGYEVSDNYDSKENITVQTFNDYDSTTNTYTITYTATDSSGNSQSATRVIKLNNPTKVFLKGETNIIHEVKTQYTDLGLVFNGCSENDFTIYTSSTININALGDYTYTYRVIEKSNSKELILTRKISVKDTTSPRIIVLQDAEIYKDEVDVYLQNNTVDYYDNFYAKSDITLDFSKETLEDRIILTYTATDPSNNKSVAKRILKFKYVLITDQNIDFIVDSSSLDDNLYKNSIIKISFKIKASSALELSRMENLNTITWQIDNVYKEKLNNKQSANLQFAEKGKHKIEIFINGRSVYTKEIFIVDSGTNNEIDSSTIGASLILIFGSIFLVVVISIPAIRKAKKKHQDLDNY